MSDYLNTDAVPDALREYKSPREELMAEIAAKRAHVIADEVRRGFEMEDDAPEPTTAPSRVPARAQRVATPAAPQFAPTVQQLHFARVGLANNPAAVGQLLAQQRERDIATVAQEYPDVFADLTHSRLAVVREDEILAADAARGIRRDQLTVLRESAQSAREMVKPRVPRRGR